MRFRPGRLALVLSPLLVIVACTSYSELGRTTQELDDRLSVRLAADMAAGRVTLQQVDYGASVTLADQSLFASDRAELNDAGRDVMTGVIQALLDPRLLRIEIAESTATPGHLQAARVQTVKQYFEDADVEAAIQPPVAMQEMPPGPAGFAGNGLVITVTVISSQPITTTAGGNAASPPVSFDGRYRGSVQVTGAAGGFDPQVCATDPRLSLQVANGAFSFTQSHPNLAGTSPGLISETTSSTYSATIAPDGSITGNSGEQNGTVEGEVSGAHMSGTINGFICFYKFTADRV